MCRVYISSCSIWPIDRTLSGATTLGQSGLGSNGNKRVLHIPQSSRAGASPSDCLMSYVGTLVGKVISLWRDAVDVFYSPSWQSYRQKEREIKDKEKRKRQANRRRKEKDKRERKQKEGEIKRQAKRGRKRLFENEENENDRVEEKKNIKRRRWVKREHIRWEIKNGYQH